MTETTKFDVGPTVERTDWRRMGIWLIAGIVMYALAAFIGGDRFPQWQTVAYKLGHVTTLAWAGYWICRGALGRLNYDSPSHPLEYLARAVLMGAVILGGSMGL